MDPEGGSQTDTLVVLVVISSLKIPKAFLIRNAVQQYFAYTFVLIFPTKLVYVIDLKLDIEPSLVQYTAGAVRVAQRPAQRPAVAR